MFDEKYLFPDGECDSLTPHHQFTTNEEIDRTAREMRETISRLIAFKQRVEKKVDDMLRELTSDNVIFKDTFAKAHGDFTRDLKCEFNLFKANVDNSMILLREEYKDLADNCTSQIREYFNDFCDLVATHRAEIGESVDEKITTFEKQIDKTIEVYQYELEKLINNHFVTQDEEIAKAVSYLMTNLETFIENAINEKVSEGIITLRYKPEFCCTPEDFGAVGDGVADDTVALQSCIKSNSYVVLKNTYRVTNSIIFDDVHNVTIYGGTIVRDRNELFNTFYGSNCSNIHIDNVIFDGNGNNRDIEYTWINDVQGAIIIAGGCDNIFVERCSIFNHNYGIFTLGADEQNVESINGSIKNCRFDNCHSAIDTYGKGLDISGNVFTNISENAIQIEPEGEPATDNLLKDSHFYQSGTGVKISGNTFMDIEGTAIIIHDNAHGIHIDGNTIIDFGYAINGCRNTYGCIISNNTIIHQKDIVVNTDKRPWDISYFAVYSGENAHVHNNYIRGAYVGVMCRERSMVCDNEIISPIVSGIVASSSDSENPTFIKGNKIKEHVKNSSAWWGANAIVLNSGVHILSETLVDSNAEPVHNQGASAIVTNLFSNVAQKSAITKANINVFNN